MNIEIWLAFVIAASLCLVIPGPTIILVLSQSIAHGRKAVIPTVLGVSLGDLCAMSLSLLGLGVVLASSAALFTLFKWCGAIYLIYLGVSLFRGQSTKRLDKLSQPKSTPGKFFKNAFVVTALNPKSIIFFVAFMPQFVHADKSNLIQLLILGATFLFLATLNAFIYARFACQLNEMMSNDRVERLFRRCGGSGLVCAGLATVALDHS